MNRLLSTLSRYSRAAQGLLRKSAARTSAGRARQRTRLYLELLEDRTVPSHLIIVGGGGTASGTNYSNGTSLTLSVGTNDSVGINSGGLALGLADLAPFGIANGVVSTNVSGQGDYSASSQISATFQIIGDNVEQLGDPVAVGYNVQNNTHAGAE